MAIDRQVEILEREAQHIIQERIEARAEAHAIAVTLFSQSRRRIDAAIAALKIYLPSPPTT